MFVTDSVDQGVLYSSYYIGLQARMLQTEDRQSTRDNEPQRQRLSHCPWAT